MNKGYEEKELEMCIVNMNNTPPNAGFNNFCFNTCKSVEKFFMI